MTALEAPFSSLLSRAALVSASTPHAARALAAAVAAAPARSAAGAAEPPSCYAGFDATAPSLHLGHLPVLLMLRRLQRLGLRPVALVGTATALVGDPSGRATGRPLLAEEACARNAAGIRANIEAVLAGDAGDAERDDGAGAGAGAGADPSPPPMRAALVLDNGDFYRNLSLLDFLRDTGRHARLSAMLARDSVKARLGGP